MKKALLGTDKNVMFIASDVACIISTECSEAKKGKKKGRKKKNEKKRGKKTKKNEKSSINKKIKRQEILCRFEQKRQTPV